VPRILVAEDDAEMRRVVVESFRKDGHQVLEAEDGLRLFEVVAAALGRPSSSTTLHLIVSDVRMPSRSGLDVLEHFAADLWLPPLVLITAFPDDEVRHRAKRLGALLLEKPILLSALRAAANDLVHKPRWVRSFG
jgi:CheY-like chemotaxis protein